VPFIQGIYFSKAAQFILFDVNTISNLPTALSLIIYSVVSYQAMRKDQANTSVSAYKLTDIKWLKNLLRLFFGLIILFIITIVINFSPFTHKPDFINYIFFLPLMCFTYWLGITTYLRQSKMRPDDIVTYNKVPAKVYFSDEDAAAYYKQLVDLMMNDHLYLDPLLKLDTLATRLKITERAISNLLNQHIGKSYNDFVNQYRVEAAKIKLADPSFDQYTIAAIAYECGFNSLATFQRCFKQFSGITPSQFMQQRKASAQLIQH
jgi:AraC-like DNA-binding protein